jgi:hypothetical protein
MTVGYPVSAADVNNKAGQLVTSVWDNLNDLHRFYLWLTDSAHTDTYLNNLAGGGITGTATSGDVQTLRNSIADLGGSSGLWAVAHGTFTPSGSNNYFFNAKLLTGTNFTG